MIQVMLRLTCWFLIDWAELLTTRDVQIYEITLIIIIAIIAALHWMQGGLVKRKLSVCPFVCLSVSLSLSNACIVTKPKKYPDFYTIR